MISIIVAVANNDVIGSNNSLPWNLPSDLKNFKQLTSGKNVVMGRKTYESLPEKNRPLPNRTNWIVSNNTNLVIDKCFVVNDLNLFLSEIKDSNTNEEFFIIGGGEIYKEAFKYADKLYLTRIYSDVEGDTKLEGFELEDWVLSGCGGVYNENDTEFTFLYYERKGFDESLRECWG